VQREYALPAAEAYRLVSEDDRRPLLVMRECEQCKGTDHALLSKDLDNEQTVLLTRWFRCVKLPPNVLTENHPFTALFARSKPGERIPHLFFSSADGSNRQELPGDQTQAQLWEMMFGILERDYVGDAKKAVKEMRALLVQMDRVDNLDLELRARLDREIDKNGPESPKVKKMTKEIDDLKQEREALVAREKALRAKALQLMKPAAPAKAAVGAGSDAR
jgi:hypothetical protein